ncbi:MAG: AAA family ATPase [Geobacter sp.]|nr:AAA family ATPase [Geobacter sp.]
MEERIITSLSDPRAYPEATTSVALIQTHVSFIFLTDGYVYKVKKPVDFGFLNFSTIDRRRFYCEEEVRLNRRLCPDLYLGVVELRETETGLSFMGTGRVVDYAVKMKRLPEERMLSRLLTTHSVGEREFREIARIVGTFHLAADQGNEISTCGTAEAIARNWNENLDQVREFVGTSLSEHDYQIIRKWALEFLTEHADLFAQRVEQGFIRDCDGDIHSGNICLADKIYIFDCIEFNSRYRYSDTTADIAFLLMDLDYHQTRGLGQVFLDEYITVTNDSGVLPLLEFYKAYRAVVRGKVESLRLKDQQIPECEREAALERSRRYFRLACGYAVRGRLPKTLFIMSGITGTGKSAIAAELAFQLGIETARSDVVRKEMAGIPVQEHRFEQHAEGIYAPAFDAGTYKRLLDLADNALANGQSVIADATFRRKIERDDFRSLAARHGARFRIICTSCPEEIVRERLEQRLANPAEPSDGRWEIYLKQKEEFDPLDDDSETIFLDTSRSIPDNIDEILKRMGIF